MPDVKVESCTTSRGPVSSDLIVLWHFNREATLIARSSGAQSSRRCLGVASERSVIGITAVAGCLFLAAGRQGLSAQEPEVLFSGPQVRSRRSSYKLNLLKLSNVEQLDVQRDSAMA